MRVASLQDLPAQHRENAARQIVKAVTTEHMPKRGKGRSKAPSVDFEALLAFQLEVSKLPAFERQVRFASGRMCTSDFGIREFSLLIEVQGGIWRKGGGAHGGGAAIERDIEKAQLAVINGWSMFPVTTDEVKQGKAVQLIELALRAKGWKS
jgi:very-short-patch-repair endonuclease